MGSAILVIGSPGSGKSRGIKSLDPKKTVVIKPNNKQLPFKGAASLYNAANKNMFVAQTFAEAGSYIDAVNKNAPNVTTVILEDLTHYFSAQVLKDAKQKGFDKWMDLAVMVFQAVVQKEATLRPDLNLIVIAHTATTMDVEGNSVIGLQTPGKLLENNVKIESYFTYVLHTIVSENAKGDTTYQLLTNRDSTHLAKSPEEMFPKYIDNDYQMIFDTIKKYQENE